MRCSRGMGLNRELRWKVHYTAVPLLFGWLTATVEPFFPTPPARMTDMLLCASKIAMPTAAHNGNTFTSVPVYGNCISDMKDLLISRQRLLKYWDFLTPLCIPDMFIDNYLSIENKSAVRFWNNFVLFFF